jgi:guanylate kinase
MDHPGNLYVVAAPSGAGKSSLVKALLAQDPRLQVSVSHTTRSPRGQEQNGREYYFISPTAFDAMVDADGFVEWAHVHNHRYGTSRQEIETRIRAGADIVLEIDYQGALQIKSLFPNAVIIFILPPSLEELKNRLIKRGEDAEAVIALRMKNAGEEIAQAPKFDFVIINDLFERALADLQMVVHAQRLRYPALRRSRPETFQALRLA